MSRTVPLLDLKAQYAPLKADIMAALESLCDSQQMILGEVTARFEQQLAAYSGTTHALGLSSGTDALLCAMMAMDIGPGDEVICPSFTFFATGGCVARLGATPVFVDIDPGTFNINPQLIEAAITPRTKAIIPVHLFGQPADMTAINIIACRHGLLTIEDAAQAIGATHHGKPVGSLGYCSATSFYPTKNLGAFGDAGAITCNDDTFFEKCRKIRVHGSGHTYFHEVIGGNFRIDALQAAVLEIKLRHLDTWNAARRRNAEIYTQAFAGSAVTPPRIMDGNVSTYNQYVVRVKDRDEVKTQLAERGIGSGVYYPLGLHGQPCFAYLNYPADSLPETIRATQEVLALPVYPELPEEDVRYVAKTLLEITS